MIYSYILQLQQQLLLLLLLLLLIIIIIIINMEHENENMENENNRETLCNWCTRYSHQSVDKGLDDLKQRGLLETIHTAALLRSTEILRIILETWVN